MASNGGYIKGQTEAMESFNPTAPDRAAIDQAQPITGSGGMPELAQFGVTNVQALGNASQYVDGVGKGFAAFKGIAKGSGQHYAAGDKTGAGQIVAVSYGGPPQNTVVHPGGAN